jgi:hypothetical protein
MDELTKEQQRLEFARVQVLINGWDSIDKLVDIRVGSELFVLRVVEDFGTVDVKSNDGGCGSTNRQQNDASIATPEKRWLVDDDGLDGDWSDGSVPGRPLQLNSNVIDFGPVDNSKHQQLLPVTPKVIPVEISLGSREEDLQIQNKAPLEDIPTKGIKRGLLLCQIRLLMLKWWKRRVHRERVE